jgi:hypothetical protein
VEAAELKVERMKEEWRLLLERAVWRIGSKACQRWTWRGPEGSGVE